MRQLREERVHAASDAQDCARDGLGGASDGEDTPPDFVPTCNHPGGIFEELPALASELMRSPTAKGQSWGNVEQTWSTPSSVKILLRRCSGVRVTFLIPTKAPRPIWFRFAYESYFEDETRHWFPILRLVTSYARCRDAAIFQFLNGSFLLVVAMMVKAAKIDVSMSVRAFEELTYLKSMGEGIFSIQMRPNYNVMAGHPNKRQRYYFFVKSDGFSFEDPPGDSFRVLWNPNLGRMQLLVSDDFDFSFLITYLLCCAVDHPDTAAYPEEFIASARAVASLSEDRWENITVEKIRRLFDRISKSKLTRTFLLFFHFVMITRTFNSSQGTGGLTYFPLLLATSDDFLCLLEQSRNRSTQLGK